MFVLVPGAGGVGWYWHRVVAELAGQGHEAVAVDIAEDDPALGLADWAAQVDDAIGTRDDTVLVAQSMGGFTAPMVSRPVARIVLVNAMIPLPGETPGEWWGAVGSDAARRANAERLGISPEYDDATYFLHDVPAEVLAEGGRMQRGTADAVWTQPCAFTAWPDVPLSVLVGRDDRFFPADFQRRVAAERLPQADVEEVAGGHLVALADPVGLTRHLVTNVRGG